MTWTGLDQTGEYASITLSCEGDDFGATELRPREELKQSYRFLVFWQENLPVVPHFFLIILPIAKRVESNFSETIADGLKTNIGERNCAIMLKLAGGALQVSENDICQALLQVWHWMKIVVEPSAAVALDAVLRNPLLFNGKKVGVLFSGGNSKFQLFKS